MRLRFNEAKTTQVAARLLKLRGAQMSYLKLIKLMYLVDREALLRWGRPVTTDCYVSMDKGPVLSRTLELITEDTRPGVETVWSRYISPPSNYEVGLLVDEPPNDELSRAEERLIQHVFDEHGRKSRWELVDLAHTLGEWQDPRGSAIPIDYRDILRAGHKTEIEISTIEQELEDLATAQNVVLSGSSTHTS